MDFDLELIGAWSAQSPGDFGAHSDRIVAFKNDGTGWFADSSYGIGELFWFGWSPASSGWVVLWTTRSFELLSGGRSREKENVESTLHLPYQVTAQITPNYEEIKALNIEIWPFGENTFGQLEADSSKLQAPFESIK